MRAYSVGGLVTAFLLIAVPALSAPILLDQSFAPPLNYHVAIGQNGRYAQTLTVGITGLMTGIDLAITRENNPPANGDVIVSILGTSLGLPDDATTLATAITPPSYWMWRHLPSDDLNIYRHLEFTPFAVTLGTQLAITVRVAEGTFHWIGGDATWDYLAGRSFQERQSTWTTMQPPWWNGNDFAFRSYVEPASASPPAVPEPASLLLFGTGLVALRTWRNRRQ